MASAASRAAASSWTPGRRWAAALVVAATMLGGCRSLPDADPVEPTVALYRTMRDAQAVAVGHFGAVPSGIFVESEIVEAVGCLHDGAIRVRTSSSETGWAPWSSLPRRLRSVETCRTPRGEDERPDAG